MPTLRAVGRATAFVALNLALVPICLLVFGFSGGPPRWLVRLWCRATLTIVGVTLHVRGTAFTACPTLFVANHVSYIDVPVLGATLDARFVAKAEVARWPLFGQLGMLTRTLFIRRQRTQARVQRDLLARGLQGGHSFVLFAEGTSTNGLSVRAFKTSLLSVAEPGVVERPIAVQPVTLAYATWRDGTPIDHGNCDLYAWHGDAELLPHLWRMLQARGVTIEVVIEPALLSWAVESRKRLGASLQQSVSLQLENLRRQELVTPPAREDSAMQHARA